MNRAVTAAAALCVLVLAAGCTVKDEPPAGVLPPVPSHTATTVTPSASTTPLPTASGSPSGPAAARPRGWTTAIDTAASSEDPKVVAEAFVSAMFLADSRTDDGNQQPFVRAVALFGTSNAAQTVTTGPQPPIGNAWMPMRTHDGWTTVKASVEEEPDAESGGNMYAASGIATVTYTDGHGWTKAGGEHYLLVLLVRDDNGKWLVDDFRVDE